MRLKKKPSYVRKSQLKTEEGILLILIFSKENSGEKEEDSEKPKQEIKVPDASVNIKVKPSTIDNNKDTENLKININKKENIANIPSNKPTKSEDKK